MKTVLINKFGGIVGDPRDTTNGACRMISQFDVLSNEKRITPFRNSEDGDSSSSTGKKKNFTVGLFLPGSTNAYRLFSLGESGSGFAEVMMKGLTTGSSDDLDDATWASPANNASAGGAFSTNFFVYYKNTGLIIGAKSNTTLWAFDPTTGAAWQDSYKSLAYTNIAQGLVHPEDDILYIPHDNKISSLNGATLSTAVVTLPSHFVINSICPFGNYLAIGAAPLDGIGNSKVFLWDRNTSYVILNEAIDWGEGSLQVLEELDGFLIGISKQSGLNFTPKLIFKYYSTAYGAQQFGEIIASSLIMGIPKQKKNSRIYFTANMTVNGSSRQGVWSVGRNKSGQFVISHDRSTENDTALGGGAIHNFYIVGDYMFISYSNNAGTVKLSKTNDAEAYTSSTSVLETCINPNMSLEDRTIKKQLKTVSLSYPPLPTNGSMVLKYRVDGGSYTTIFTETVDGTLTTEAKNESDGKPFQAGREYEFQISSSGGGEITEFKYTYEPLKTLI
jgi:hypothetical protein